MSGYSIECECEACDGTGLYVGFGEGKGVAVECKSCDGTGKSFVKYKPFEGRKKREGITRVIQCNPGWKVSADMRETGGLPYEEWAEGKPFPLGSEMREFVCPAWWYQSADYKKKPEWEQCDRMLGRVFSDCELFGKKDGCWARFDIEQSSVRKAK